MIGYSRSFTPCQVEGHQYYNVIDSGGCSECYKARSKAEKRAEKEAAKPKPDPIAKVSKKQAKINSDMDKTRKLMATDSPNVCAGCGKPQGGVIVLEDSHKISRKQCIDFGRMDLYAERKNQTKHCRTWLDHKGCHCKWHSNAERHTLNDYTDNMKYIAQADTRIYKEMIQGELKALEMRMKEKQLK